MLIYLPLVQENELQKEVDPKQIATEMMFTPSCRKKNLKNISIFAYSESTQNNRFLVFNAIFFCYSNKNRNFRGHRFFLN